jgi:hypothetical protein
MLPSWVILLCLLVIWTCKDCYVKRLTWDQVSHHNTKTPNTKTLSYKYTKDCCVKRLTCGKFLITNTKALMKNTKLRTTILYANLIVLQVSTIEHYCCYHFHLKILRMLLDSMVNFIWEHVFVLAALFMLI